MLLFFIKQKFKLPSFFIGRTYLRALLSFVIVSAFVSISCKAHAPSEMQTVNKDSLVFGGKDSKWPVLLESKLRFPKSSILSIALTKSSKGGFIQLSSKENTKDIWVYYKELFQNKTWKVLLKNSRPSKKKDLLKKYPELAKKAGIELDDEKNPGNHFIIVAEGSTGLYLDQTIVSVSILSFADHSEIRLYFKPLPSGTKNYFK